MPNYLSQYQRFSQGVTQTLDASRANALNRISKSLDAQSKIRAERNQAEINRRADQRSKIADDARDFDAGGMWDWQSEMLDQQRMSIGKSWMDGDIDELEYTNMLVGLGRNAEGYKAAYESSVGNPGSSKNTDPTFWGVTKAMESTLAGDNPYDEADMIIEGMDKGIDGVEKAQKNLIYRFNSKNKGKSPGQQVLGGEYNEKFEWILTVGDPEDSSTHIKVPVNEYLANDEGRNSFLPSFSDINFDTIQDYSTSEQLKTKMGEGGGANEISQWYNDEILTNEKFRRDLFHQLGSFHISEGSQLDAAKTLFRKSPVETYGITSNEDGSELTYSDDPMSRKIKSIVDAGRQMLINENVSRDEPDSDAPDMDYNDIRFEQFDKQGALSAYDRMPRGRFEGALTSMMPGMFPAYDPDVVDGISTMTVIPSTEIGAGSDTFGKAVALGRDGRMIVKVVKETPVQLTDAQILAGISAESLPAIEAVDYMVLPQNLEANFYKEIGKQISPDSTDHEEVGMQYLYETYINVDQNEAPISPRAVNTQSSPPSGLAPGEPADIEPDYSSIYPGDSAPTSEMRLLKKLTTTFGERSEAASWLEWMRESPERFNMVMGEIEKGRRPGFDPLTGELIFETIG